MKYSPCVDFARGAPADGIKISNITASTDGARWANWSRKADGFSSSAGVGYVKL